MTTPLFTVSSGRSGTFLIHKILSLYPEVESHHEYCIEHTQKLSVLYRAGLIDHRQAAAKMGETHRAGAFYSQVALFCDSSNKLSYLIDPLLTTLSSSRFIYLVRDGRRVVSSLFHKLADESYVTKWVSALDGVIDGGKPLPPIAKSVYWPFPNPEKESDLYCKFMFEWDRWQRICWYWQDVNQAIIDGLEYVKDDRQHFLRLEDLTTDPAQLQALLAFIGLSWKDEAWDLCQVPQNVNEPVSYGLTPEQEEQYFEIAGAMHERLGYGGTDDYVVKYQNPVS